MLIGTVRGSFGGFGVTTLSVCMGTVIRPSGGRGVKTLSQSWAYEDQYRIV